MSILQPRRDQSPIRGILINGMGLIVGLFLGVPPALGAHTLGLPWLPYGIAVIVIGMVIGLLLAFTASEFLPSFEAAADATIPERRAPAPDVSRKRLADRKARLDQLIQERKRRGESDFGKTTELNIVWSELLELELQEIDERSGRLREEHQP
jgi:hypothetical protein